jgi:hypothetical protein
MSSVTMSSWGDETSKKYKYLRLVLFWFFLLPTGPILVGLFDGLIFSRTYTGLGFDAGLERLFYHVIVLPLICATICSILYHLKTWGVREKLVSILFYIPVFYILSLVVFFFCVFITLELIKIVI